MSDEWQGRNILKTEQKREKEKDKRLLCRILPLGSMPAGNIPGICLWDPNKIKLVIT